MNQHPTSIYVQCTTLNVASYYSPQLLVDNTVTLKTIFFYTNIVKR